MTETEPACREILIAEYGATQSSAEHHDSLLWSATSIIWSGNLVLLGLAVTSLDTPHAIPLLTALAVLGCVLIWFVDKFARDFRDIKNQKYKRCKEIEKSLGLMRQHTDVQTAEGHQRRMYAVVSVLFTLTWVVVVLVAFLQA